MDVTMCVANFSDLPNCQPNMKVDATLDKMRGDLSKWVESGRLKEEEETWWKGYLGSCVRETRLRPGVPKSTELPKYACTQAVPNEDLTSLEQAIDRHIEKENRTNGLTKIQTNEPRHEKTNVLVSDLARHKPGCTDTEDC